MFFSKTDNTVSFCDDRNGRDGCGNRDYVLPDEFENQYCSQCGKKTKKARFQKGIEIVCPNGHDLINDNHKMCIVCGVVLRIKEKCLVTTF